MGKLNKLEIINNEPIATSRDIVEKLGKNHNHVVAKIKDVLTMSEYRQREYSYGNNNRGDRMTRITDKERQEFHLLLDVALMKLDTDKNSKKCHWSELLFTQLNKMIGIESRELDLATHNKNVGEIDSELDDILNLTLFYKHNLMLGN